MDSRAKQTQASEIAQNELLELEGLITLSGPLFYPVSVWMDQAGNQSLFIYGMFGVLVLPQSSAVAYSVALNPFPNHAAVFVNYVLGLIGPPWQEAVIVVVGPSPVAPSPLSAAMTPKRYRIAQERSWRANFSGVPNQQNDIPPIAFTGQP